MSSLTIISTHISSAMLELVSAHCRNTNVQNGLHRRYCHSRRQSDLPSLRLPMFYCCAIFMVVTAITIGSHSNVYHERNLVWLYGDHHTCSVVPRREVVQGIAVSASLLPVRQYQHTHCYYTYCLVHVIGRSTMARRQLLV